MTKIVHIAAELLEQNLDKSVEEQAIILMNDERIKHPGFTIAQARKLVFRTKEWVENNG